MNGKGSDIHELTRIEAYLLSEKAGHPSHMHDYFWTQAEAIVRQRVTIVDVAVKAAGKKPATTGKAIRKKPTVAKTVPAATRPAVSKGSKKTLDPQLLLGEKPAAVKRAGTTAKKKATGTPDNKIAAKASLAPGKTAPKTGPKSK